MTTALQRAAEEKVKEAQAVHEQAKRERIATSACLRSAGFPGRPMNKPRRRKSPAPVSRRLPVPGPRRRPTRWRTKSGPFADRGEESGKDRGVDPVSSPVSGRVLKIQEKSERVVSAGTPLLVLGDPARLEVVVDLLSSEAVKVKPGMPVMLENWGGDQPLRARVRLIEDQGFTKVSALGIEEQRVNVIADFVDPPWPLGDDYRVEARIVIWEGRNILKIPASSLFRSGTEWAVFVDRKRPGPEADRGAGSPHLPGSGAPERLKGRRVGYLPPHQPDRGGNQNNKEVGAGS